MVSNESRDRILVVEDDVNIREMLSLILAEEGFDVRHAENGRHALTILHTWRADLILLDLMMPVMDGLAFRAEQKLIPSIANIPVVVLSASQPLRELRPEGLDCAAVLSKPCDLDLLIETIRRVTHASRAQPALSAEPAWA
jgi:CheY-like chemotaxis protein